MVNTKLVPSQLGKPASVTDFLHVCLFSIILQLSGPSHYGRMTHSAPQNCSQPGKTAVATIFIQGGIPFLPSLRLLFSPFPFPSPPAFAPPFLLLTPMMQPGVWGRCKLPQQLQADKQFLMNLELKIKYLTTTILA